MKSSAPLAATFVVLALVCFVVAALYATGNLQVFTSAAGKHYKHGILFGGLGVLALVAANFVRPHSEA